MTDKPTPTNWPAANAAWQAALHPAPTSDKSQIELLADFIMAEIPGEPSQSEGAGDCAIRLLKQYRADNAKLDSVFATACEIIEELENTDPRQRIAELERALAHCEAFDAPAELVEAREEIARLTSPDPRADGDT